MQNSRSEHREKRSKNEILHFQHRRLGLCRFLISAALSQRELHFDCTRRAAIETPQVRVLCFSRRCRSNRRKTNGYEDGDPGSLKWWGVDSVFRC